VKQELKNVYLHFDCPG